MIHDVAKGHGAVFHREFGLDAIASPVTRAVNQKETKPVAEGSREALENPVISED